MQDTSFAIHPGNEKETEAVKFYDIGKVKSWTNENGLLQFVCDNGYVNVQFYCEDIIRVTMNPYTIPTMEQSFALVKEKEEVDFSAEKADETISITSSKMSAEVRMNPFRLTVKDKEGRVLVSEGERGMAFNHKKEVICFKEMEKNDHFYGFGEKTNFLDKRGEKMTMWNTDVFAPHNPEIDSLYESIPYFMTIRDGQAHGLFFDNTFKSVFDMKSQKEMYSFSAEGGELDYYVMSGPSPKEVVEQYTRLTGRMEIPPKWSLGYHQSRYSYKTEAEVRELVQSFKEKDIPLDAIYLDIHYMDGYRVFTFDYDRFPNPEKLIQDLKADGIHVVPIVDPGVKEDPEYDIYQEGIRGDYFCKYAEGNIYHGEVWPGNSAFPDFTNTDVRKWWGEKQKVYTDMGIEGIWNDMNEPAVFNETKTMDIKVMHDHDGNPKTHRELHNTYGLFMGEATYNGLKRLIGGNRPFLLTRAGYSGVQRYAAVWTGDNRSFWEHMQMAMPMCMNLGMSGVAFTGPDVGGFAHDTTGDLLARWTQLGAFTPYFRNHSNLGTIQQEPWAFGEEVEKVTKKYIQLRYKWLPYLYSLFREAHLTGAPVMRPLVMEYPNDPHTFNLSDQFLIGDQVLIAPITKPDTYHRVVYLPEGEWINYWTEEKVEGNKHILAEADFETLPIFIKSGAIIPEAEVTSSTSVEGKSLSLHIYPSDQVSKYQLYEDDGRTFAYQNGEYYEMDITAEVKGGALYIETNVTNNSYLPAFKTLQFNVHSADKTLKMYINGQEAKQITIDS